MVTKLSFFQFILKPVDFKYNCSYKVYTTYFTSLYVYVHNRSNLWALHVVPTQTRSYFCLLMHTYLHRIKLLFKLNKYKLLICTLNSVTWMILFEFLFISTGKSCTSCPLTVCMFVYQLSVYSLSKQMLYKFKIQMRVSAIHCKNVSLI